MTSNTLTLLGILAPTIAVVVNAILGSLGRRRIKKNLERQDDKIAEIHVLVNNRLTSALDRIAILTAQISQDAPSDLQHRQAATDAAEDRATLSQPDS